MNRWEDSVFSMFESGEELLEQLWAEESGYADMRPPTEDETLCLEPKEEP